MELMAFWTNKNIESIDIYNLNGELVMQNKYNSVSGVSIDVSSLVNAMYIISIQSKHAIDVHKFIKF
jgi:hypothetical protein